MEARSSYRFAPPTVNPDETTVARWYDDRTRRACVTRGEGSCEGAVDSLGRVAPWEGTKKHSKTTYRGPAELAYLRVTHCAKWSFGFGAGWDRREIFVFFFGSECARPPGVPRMDVAPGASETEAAVRRFACDLIVHKHTTSATCLRGSLCTAAVDLPRRVGEHGDVASALRPGWRPGCPVFTPSWPRWRWPSRALPAPAWRHPRRPSSLSRTPPNRTSGGAPSPARAPSAPQRGRPWRAGRRRSR